MFISHQQYAEQYHSITGHKSFESVKHIKYWRTTLTYQNSFHGETDLTMGMYTTTLFSMQNKKIKTYRSMIFSLFHMGVKLTDSHTEGKK